MLTVDPVPWDDAGAAALRREMFDDVALLYPESRDRVSALGGYDVYDARAGGGLVVAFLGHLDGAPAGFVAVSRLRLPDEPTEGVGAVAAGVAELRRMYVRPPMRGRGVARALLAAAEHASVGAGLHRMVLETGAAQVSAHRLYRAAGYAVIPPYPPYHGDPTAVCFRKDLVRPTEATSQAP